MAADTCNDSEDRRGGRATKPSHINRNEHHERPNMNGNDLLTTAWLVGPMPRENSYFSDGVGGGVLACW